MSFEHAPVTKALMIGAAVSSFVVGTFDVKHYFHLQLVPHISRHHQYWRLGVHHLAFSNSSDLFISELILFSAAVHIERRFGSAKFASFALVSALVSTILEFAALLLFHRIGLNHVSAGPLTLVFNILYQYSRIVPSMYQFRVFGVPLSNKSFTYLLAAQLALSRVPGSAAAAILGILTGQLYRSDLASLKTYRIPPFVVEFSRRYLRPLVGSTRPIRRSNRALPDATSTPSTSTSGPGTTQDQDEEVITTAQPTEAADRGANAGGSDGGGVASGPSVVREWVNELTGRTDRGNVGIRVPTDAEITQVASMFPDLSREVIVTALQRSPSIEGAVETLLSSQA
ncbi:hypothetical protein HGRIS_010119 [Hohenbuehelia grisea]|uniref:CUE domain-containing protein n=1 Tax=Hohenbuehelia grisea TaxID=104357 RepID=A0ABR3J3Q0_9AGAR